MRVTSRGPFRLSFLTAINSLLACGKLSGGITLDDQPQGAFRQPIWWRENGRVCFLCSIMSRLRRVSVSINLRRAAAVR